MYREEILKGIDFLKSIQNSDGGIPGMKERGESACWTTAEALETVLLSPYISMEHYNFIFGMIDYLLNTQLNDKDNSEKYGAWPEYPSTNRAQTITTGHALSALSLAKGIIVDNDNLLCEVNNAIDHGFSYLRSVQNNDGGWGIEPEGSNEEKISCPLGTIFVLRGYNQNGFYSNNNTTVRAGCDYLLCLRDTKTGGFSKPNEEPDVCYTARIISTFIKSNHFTGNDKVIKQGLKFIFKDKSLKTLFKIKHDPYISENSTGMVVFHNNTPIDVIEALCLSNIHDRRVKKIEQWILSTQEERGFWYLGGSRKAEINEGVVSWTTNEAIYSLICLEHTYYIKDYKMIKNKGRIWRKMFISMSIIAIILLFSPSIVSPDNKLYELWSNLSEKIKTFIISTVFMGLVINIFSNTIYDYIMKILKKQR